MTDRAPLWGRPIAALTFPGHDPGGQLSRPFPHESGSEWWLDEDGRYYWRAWHRQSVYATAVAGSLDDLRDRVVAAIAEVRMAEMGVSRQQYAEYCATCLRMAGTSGSA